MKVSSKLVIALNNGTDQVVNIGDFREIQDSGMGHSRHQGAGQNLDKIVDGMSVVIGGIDTGPDYGLEGIVVNMVENKQVEGGKMCLVMLSEDTSKLVMIPIANLLVGEIATQAIARRAALKGFEEKINPDAEELYDILQECRKQGMSLKKIVTQLRTLHPNWEVSEKRVKKYLKELEMGGPRSDSAASGAKTKINTEKEEGEECPEPEGEKVKAIFNMESFSTGVFCSNIYLIASGHNNATGIHVENGVRICCGHVRMPCVLECHPPGRVRRQLICMQIVTYFVFLFTGKGGRSVCL